MARDTLDSPTSDELRRLLRYEPSTGKLYWLPRGEDYFPEARARNSWNAKHAGQEALRSLVGGYRMGEIFYKSYAAHRVIWAIVTGEWPHDQIDHVNGVRDDNRLSNLRAVSGAENARNRRLQQNNSSGVAGVSWTASEQSWRANIRVGGRTITLGRFKNFEDAVRVRKAAEAEHGFHANHGRAGLAK